jgi:hypothetical protein
MRAVRTVAYVLLSMLLSTPAFAQQPATAPAGPASGKFWTGLIVGAAGGTAVILGTTSLKTRDTTSGNTPLGAYDTCVALRTNPVYRGNECDVLKGPNTALVVGGAVLMAAGTALMVWTRAHNSIQFGPGSVRFQHRMTF